MYIHESHELAFRHYNPLITNNEKKKLRFHINPLEGDRRPQAKCECV